jgi:uncharacterized membrane protein YeaQ/YmgE (transglycosylase-associated protein family)
MDVNLAFLAVQIIAGILGGWAAATVTHEHSLGVLSHALLGAAGGFLSGYFAQSLVLSVVAGDGTISTHDPNVDLFIQALAGGLAGAVLVMIGGMIKHAIERQHH